MQRIRVRDAAKRLSLSCKALVSILKEMGFPDRGYSAYLNYEEYQKVKEKIREEKERAKESLRFKGGKRYSAQHPPLNEALIQKRVQKTLSSLERKEIVKRKRLRRKEEGEVEKKVVKITPYMTVAELASVFERLPSEIIKKCLDMGMIVTINQRLDLDTEMLLAAEFGIEAEVEEIEEILSPPSGEKKRRPPVVVVIGHVDHGKTTLLDYIRKTKVAEREAGHITQNVGAYVVNFNEGQITFLDTPGHEAFTAMRARGLQVTDIAVLVVAADEGVMPQTREAIDHARAAQVPIICAITKIDKPQANPNWVKAQLAENGIRVEGYGGDVLCVETSAYTGQGINDLLAAINLVAEGLDLSVVYDTRARGVVLDGRLEKGRGWIATILVQEGTLKKGDIFVCGEFYGRVRELLNENFEKVSSVTPGLPVQVLGFPGEPSVGERFLVVEDEWQAREIAQKKALAKRESTLKLQKRLTLELVQDKIKTGEIKELHLILKGDASGPVSALRDALENLSLPEVRIRIIHSGAGAITKSDVLLAEASEAIIIGYNTEPLPDAREYAEQAGIEIRTYKVIHAAIDDVRAAMFGLLEPKVEEVFCGRARVKKLFNIPKVGIVAGCIVEEGKIERGAIVRLFRGGKEIFKGEISSLKRFKEDVSLVEAGQECGVLINNLEDIAPDDILEVYKEEKK
jgi:translation initiation factor IF-2|uniref:Translation initiation factor IF-2 n=1 Tax=candidate division WOR-3 bacterium TaxID=2052148 RepID=A0A7C3YSF1_UNCW3